MLYSELTAYTHQELSALTHYELSLSRFRLVTNRTQDDVERWKELRAKGWIGMTEIERQEWLGEIVTTPAATRGMYTHVDFNRVESAVATILERFKNLGYKVPTLTIKTDWSYSDELRDTDMKRYYDNIAVIRSLIPLSSSTPMAPTINDRLDYKRANDIEQILTDVNIAVENLTQSWFYAGEVLSGEV